MWSRFKGNGLFVFSDPAGAKACLALDDILTGENISGKRKLVSNKKYSFYKQFKSNITIVDNAGFKDTKNSMINDIDWIFTGTSHPESSDCFELKYLENIKVKSYSFIDHWTNFHLRFELKSKIIFPDIIFVIDEAAKVLAIKDGLPIEKIELFENPYLIYLKKYRGKLLNKHEFCTKLNISNKKKILLYAPDPISLRSGRKRNELDILKELTDTKITDIFTVILKLHPLQPLDGMSKLIKQHNLKVVTDVDFMPLDIFVNVDAIIGFYSNFLIEAASINKNIIQYQINENDGELLARLKIPGVFVFNKHTLLTELNNIL